MTDTTEEKPKEILEVIETPIFTCECGCKWFESRQICEFEHGSKYSQDPYVPITIMNLVKCAYCGAFYDEKGKRINIDVLMLPK